MNARRGILLRRVGFTVLPVR